MSEKLKLLPKGIQSFSKIREDGYIYVDKTQHIYNLITKGDYYFLSRPRRFGKSLLISTLAALFSGQKELFKGLWIEISDYDWKKHPVIQFSFSAMAHESPQALHDDIVWTLKRIAQDNAINIDDAPSIQTKFALLVKQLAQTNKVVILVDEYDYAMLSNIQDMALAESCRNILRDFFGTMKDLDAYIRFVFITGVSKFSKASIFSGLNNLEDITISEPAATLLGYTPAELSSSFEPHIKKIAQQQKVSPENIIEQMRVWYDGYLFDLENPVKVYNPYSVLLFLNSGRFLNYWFETGTPSFLINLIKTQDFPIINLDTLEANIEELSNNDLDDVAITPLLFQTGYLTLESYDPLTENYKLTFPNFEVRKSFLMHILKKFTKISLSTINTFAVKLINALETDNVDLFCRILQTFFADIPSSLQIPLERYYQTILFVLAKILNLTVQAEVETNLGFIDMVIELKNHIYILEFKLNANAQRAMNQIERKQYYQKYVLRGKKIVLVGITFDTKQRNLAQWITKEL